LGLKRFFTREMADLSASAKTAGAISVMVEGSGVVDKEPTATAFENFQKVPF
jgi:hypothetical protein